MLKVRASWANVGNDTNPYTLTDAYTASSSYPGSYQIPAALANYYIKPENIESYEFGLETMFFHNRLGLDVAYYNSSTTNQICERHHGLYHRFVVAPSQLRWRSATAVWK